jgi:hypothetical protein
MKSGTDKKTVAPKRRRSVDRRGHRALTGAARAQMRSCSITLFHAATKSFVNFVLPSLAA